MGIFEAISSVIVGWMQVNKASKLAEDWFKQGMSIFGTAFVCFFGTFGAVGYTSIKTGDAPLVAFMLALFMGSGAMAAGVGLLWLRSPLTRGIPLLVPMSVEKHMQESDHVYHEPNAEKEK